MGSWTGTRPHEVVACTMVDKTVEKGYLPRAVDLGKREDGYADRRDQNAFARKNSDTSLWSGSDMSGDLSDRSNVSNLSGFSASEAFDFETGGKVPYHSDGRPYTQE